VAILSARNIGQLRGPGTWGSGGYFNLLQEQEY